MPSESGEYEDICEWGNVKDLFGDLEPDAPSDKEENILVLFLQRQKKPSHAGAAKLIAAERGVDFSDLFPFHANQTAESIFYFFTSD